MPNDASIFHLLAQYIPRPNNWLRNIQQLKTENANPTIHKKYNSQQEAINFALSLATKKDVVLICGKGAEDYQDINGVKYPFSDKEVVLKYFKKLNGK